MTALSLATTAGGVPVGATMLYQATASKPGNAGFVDGRNLGQLLRALQRGDDHAVDRAVLHGADQRRDVDGGEIDVAADQIGDDVAAAAIGDVGHLGAGLPLHQLHDQMRLRADARRADRDPAGIGPRVIEHRRERARRELRRRRDQERRLRQQHDRSESTIRVERHRLVHEAVGGQHAGRPEQQRVAVGLGLGGRGGADVAVGAGAVVDHDLLAELRARSPAASRRAGRSSAPPAANGTIRVIGRVGQVCAGADAGARIGGDERERNSEGAVTMPISSDSSDRCRRAS